MTDDLELSPLDIAGPAEDWAALALEAGNIFGTPEWVSTWWRHYGSGRRLIATACRDGDGGLVGVLPLYLWMRRPLPVARFLGHDTGDALGPVCRSSDRAVVASALMRCLEEHGAALLVGEHMPGDEGWSALLGAKVLSREASPVLTLDGMSWETFLASRSRNFRGSIRSKERRLAADHHVTYRRSATPEGFERDFDQLFALHRARWPRGSSFTAAEPFQRAFAATAFARGWCRLWFLEIDGVARAAWYGFRFADVECYYQAGRDPGWDHYSLGFLMLAHTIREAALDGAREYRFLRGGEEFKYRFASHDPALETLAFGRTLAGRTAVQTAARIRGHHLRRLMRVSAGQ